MVAADGGGPPLPANPEDYTELKRVYVYLTEAPQKGWHYITYGKP